VELIRLIEALSRPSAYPHAVADVVVRQTHISAVFLAGDFAYKIKKPLDLGFLDYTTLGRRRHFCDEEVRLNRRLAPSVYLGVVPVTLDGDRVLMEGRGEVVEWAVKMERLPDDATLRERVRRGEVGVAQVETLARRIADFHDRAEAGPEISACGRFDVVAGNSRENFAQAASQVGTTLKRAVFERFRSLTERALADLRPLIEDRARRGVPRDGHGDLRLDHVYLFPRRQPPSDWVVVDTIEFNERLRCADPMADLAFLVMDFAFHGREDLATAVADSYVRASGDAEGRDLLPFYASYRAAVRGKVEGMKLEEPEVPEAERVAALGRARAHWLLALGMLEDADRRPCLVLVGGLPGSGKSTLSRGLAERAGLAVVRSDLVRKEFAGPSRGTAAPSPFEEGIYTPEWTDRTYAECLSRAEALMFEGRRVLVDATFRGEADRRTFLDVAARWGVPALLLLCRAEPAVVRERLRLRRDDVSDADWPIHLRAAERWDEPGPETLRAARTIDTGGASEEAVIQALDALGSLGLIDRARVRGGP
jgi:aminoglycoside phosphotransferase family enzyme/predicted kinase